MLADLMNPGTIIGLMVDADQRKMSFIQDGEELAAEFAVDNIGNGVFPALSMARGSMDVNLGERPFQFCPQGFSGVITAVNRCVDE